MASIQDKPLALAGLALATGLAVYTISKATQKPKYTLPPSPPSYPVIGNLFSIPQEFEYLGYMKIGEELGSKIISVSALGTTMIILNDREDAENLFEKRSAIYSDRTVPPMVSEPSLLNWGHYLAIAGYGDRWKMYRRLINPWLSKRSSDGFQRSQTHETHLFLTRLLARGTGTITSEACESELYLTIAGTMLRAIYGYTVKSLDDPLMVGAQKAISNLTKAMMPSNFMVNVIPALVHVPDWFPGTGWKATARAWRKQKDDLLEESYRTAMANIERENHETIMAKTSKSEALRLGLTEEQADEYVREAALGLFGGGADTSVNTLLMFFIAMLLFPEVQKKAQEELDSVLGTSRLPTVEDQEKLPYIGRFIQETLRWAPAGPLALPHTCFQDDKYLGYDIPKGAILFGNVWAMTRDPKVYKDPETFDPDRFLDPSVPHPPTFGWGRRACPGIYFAETSLFLVIASVLMTFNIRPAQDEHGRDIKTTLRIANEITLRPEPFKFRLVPRSARHDELIRTSV